MAAVLEITGRGSAVHADVARQWHDNVATPCWSRLPALTAYDLYVPAVGGPTDPMVDDGPGPHFMLMLEFSTAEALQRAVRSSDFGTPVSLVPAGLALTADAMERRFYSVAAENEAMPLSAPFSYSVRYHRPAEDEARFVKFYLDNHPPLLGRLPGVRNVICYLPMSGVAVTCLPSADYMLGNEVVFDAPEAFNAAMASEVRRELRADFKRFPPFAGQNTHYPMARRRLIG